MSNRILSFIVTAILVSPAIAAADNVSVSQMSPNVKIEAPTAGTYSDLIGVYATVEDDNLENYHFRVVKEGSPEGHTCTESGALFAIENQGHASTTLGKSVCGFSYNRSVYIETSFVNQLIATVDAEALISFGGEGDYWLILGARDTSGNRSHIDYFSDPRVKVTIASSTITQTNDSSPSSSSNSDSGSSLSGSRRHNISYLLEDTAGGTSEITVVPTGSYYETSGIVLGESDESATTTASTTQALDTENLAAVGSSFELNWWWLVLILALLGAGSLTYKLTS